MQRHEEQSGVEAGFGENWQAVEHLMTAAYVKLTRQEILEDWPADYDKPDPATLWRWLTRAVVQGVLRQDGTGKPNEPFRYWLPARTELMRPDYNAPREAFELWKNRYTADLCGKLGFPPAAEPAATVPLPGDERAEGEPAAAPVQAEPDPEPPKAPEPPAPPTAEDVSHLPYPFNLMTPDAVPEYVWKQASEDKAKVKTNPN